jgi:hypothetical protein
MPARWTFMVYMAGFNNLSDFATKDLEEMRQVGSTDDVKIAVFVKRLNQRSAHHLVVQRGGRDEEHQVVGNVDSGNPQTMLDFIRWAARVAPAERYALVVWNHGSGWSADDLDQLYADVRVERGDSGVTPREIALLRSTGTISRTLFTRPLAEVLSLETAQERAIASDDGTGHSLDTIELNRVLKKGHQSVLRQPFELLGMDACLMSTLEVAFEVQPHVRTVVGSEELEPGDGWPYTRILKDLVDDPSMDGAALGSAIVKRYIASYRQRQGEWPVTQCAVSAEGIEPFGRTVSALAKALSRAVRDDADAARVFRAHTRSVRFHGELVDLRTFCRELRATGIAGAVKDAAGDVIDALKPDGYVIAEGHLGPTVDGCAGVTAYLPPPQESISQFYRDLRFAKRHGWDEFLAAYHGAFGGD